MHASVTSTSFIHYYETLFRHLGGFRHCKLQWKADLGKMDLMNIDAFREVFSVDGTLLDTGDIANLVKMTE